MPTAEQAMAGMCSAGRGLLSVLRALPANGADWQDAGAAMRVILMRWCWVSRESARSSTGGETVAGLGGGICWGGVLG